MSVRKTMNTSYALLGLLLWIFNPCLGQQGSMAGGQGTMPAATFAGLKVGDTLPELLIPRLINNQGKPLRTGDFKEQLLILDFWATTCGSCVVQLPKLAKLQQQFRGRLQVLPVTPEKKGLVQSFWKNNKHLKSVNLPSVVEDTLLSRYIRHRFVSHEAWIYKGKVIAITGADYVDSSTVSRVLSGEKINFPLKYDFYNYDFNRPLFALDTSQVDPVHTRLEYVAISGYRKGVSTDGLVVVDIKRDSARNKARVYIVNTEIFKAYLLLSIKAGLMLPSEQGFSPNQVVWEVGNRNRFQYRGKKMSGYLPDWEALNVLCYESVRADTGQTDKQLYLQTLADLNALLGLNVRWERRKETVLVLKYDAEAKKQMLSEGLSSGNLANSMNQVDGSFYVWDESGGKVWLPTRFADFKNLDSIARAILPYGLRLEQQQREMYKLVFGETTPLLPDGKLVMEFQRRKALQVGIKHAEPEENTAYMEHNKKLPGVVTLPSGLQYKVLCEGKGRSPSTADKVRVHYTGMQVNGKIFESTLEGGIPRVVKVSDMIPGWVQGLPLMREGAKWALYIPPALAYGERTGQGKFPANSTLVFELELLEIVNPAKK
jgi:FKBP-type peptidyl-prolyl cis-trans isomerase/thiol-disulfide isomerase/thioredoxin